jgi:hypothetical protein
LIQSFLRSSSHVKSLVRTRVNQRRLLHKLVIPAPSFFSISRTVVSIRTFVTSILLLPEPGGPPIKIASVPVEGLTAPSILKSVRVNQIVSVVSSVGTRTRPRFAEVFLSSASPDRNRRRRFLKYHRCAAGLSFESLVAFWWLFSSRCPVRRPE